MEFVATLTKICPVLVVASHTQILIQSFTNIRPS